MPPDITAGLMALAGQSLGHAASGKTGTGPPETSGPSSIPLKANLFALILAETGKSPAKQPQLSKNTLGGTTRRPVLSLPVLHPRDPFPGVRPPLKPRQAAVLSTLRDANNLLLTSLRPMDILPKLPVTKTGKDKADELPLHKVSADDKTPVVSISALAEKVTVPALSLPIPTAVPVSVPPVSVPPVSVLPTLVPQDLSTARLPSAAVPPLPASAVLSSFGATFPKVSLPLPRTFAVAAVTPAAMPAPLTAVLSPLTDVPAMPQAAVLPLEKVVSTPLARLPSVSKESGTGFSVAEAKPNLHPALAVTHEAAAASSPPGRISPASSPEADPASATVLASSTSALLIMEAVAATAPNPAGRATATNPALKALPTQPTEGGVVLQGGIRILGGVQDSELTLKPAAQNADINTRMLEAAKETAIVRASSSAPALKPALSPKNDAASVTAAPTGTLAPAAAMDAVVPAKPVSAADRAEIVRQAAEGLKTMPLPAKPGGVQQMSLQLHPKDWGSLQVSVTVRPGPDSAKTVTAHIVAETSQVKAALQSGNGALHQALRASGLNLEHLTVSVRAPEPKEAAVKPASESASAGFTSGQGQHSMSGQPNTSGSPGPASQSSGFSAFGGDTQDRRQGQPPVFAGGLAEPEADENRTPMPIPVPIRGRVDTHA